MKSQSQKKLKWLKECGAVLIVINNQSNNLLNEMENSLCSIYQFYNTFIYKYVMNEFNKNDITFLNIDDIDNGPNEYVILPQIFITPSSSNSIRIHFPVFLSYYDILKLIELNIYQAFNDEIWTQFYYFKHFNQYNGCKQQFKICDNITFSHYHQVINVNKYNIIIENKASNGNVSKQKIKNVAITELNKSNSYSFKICQFGKYYHDGNILLIISMDINHINNKENHFKIIMENMARHIQNNINTKSARYVLRRCRDVSFIDFQTEMKQYHEWNIPKYWLSTSTTTPSPNQKYYVISEHTQKLNNINDNMDIFNMSGSKIVVGQKQKIQEKKENDYIEYDYSDESPTPSPRAVTPKALTPKAASPKPTYIDSCMSCYQPGAPKEINKQLQKEKMLKEKDYRGFIICSPHKMHNFAVIINVDYNDNQYQYEIIDYDNTKKWIILTKTQEHLRKDMLNDNMNDDEKESLIQCLTPKQINSIFKFMLSKIRL